jgi:hypothetical protein
MSPWLVFSFLATVAQAAQLGAGAGATAGSGGYSRFAVHGDVSGKAETVEPFGWLELSSDDNIRQAGLGGGAWKPLDNGAWVKGGAGFLTGRLKDSDRTMGSLLLETAIEKTFETPTLGAEYKLTWGSIANATALREKARGRPASALETERFAYNEVAGYVFMPAGKNTLGLRLAQGFGTEVRSVTSETVSLRVPVSEPLSLLSSLTLEQAGGTYVYGSIGLAFRTGSR